MNPYKNPVLNLEKLVAFKTVSDSPMLDICDWVAQACHSFGFACELQKDPSNKTKANVVAHIGPKTPGGLIISGHLDVVPTQGQPWESDPFCLTEKAGLLYGRGTSDMKGFIAATLCAFNELDLQNLKKPLVLIWTYDEEIGCKGSAQFALTNKTLPDWYPREALIGEPTDLQILRMHPGHVSFQISIKGKAAHSSKPDLGISAIKAGNQILSLLAKLEHDLKEERRLEEHLERPYVTLNIGMIHGGQAVNIVPDQCEITVGYRPLPGDDPKAVLTRFEERLDHARSELLAEVEVSLKSLTPALFTPAGSPLADILQPHACPQKICAASFATDGGNLATLGISSLIFGPGSIDVAHRANEFIEKRALEQAPAMIADIIRRRCG